MMKLIKINKNTKIKDKLKETNKLNKYNKTKIKIDLKETNKLNKYNKTKLMKKSKKSQVNAFIILGLLIIFLVMLFFFLRFQSRDPLNLDKNIDIMSAREQVRSQVKNCLDIANKEIFIYLGLTGGYMTLPEEHLSLENISAAYYFDDGKISYPDLKSNEEEAEQYLDEHLSVCLNKLSTVKVNNALVKTDIKMYDDTVGVDVHWPLEVELGDKRAILQDFSFSYPVRIKQLLEESKRVVNIIEENSTFIDISSISKSEFVIDMIDVGGGNMIFFIEDDYKNFDYVYVFAARVTK